MRTLTLGLVSALILGAFAAAASAQNPVQWSGDTRGAVKFAKEQSLPLLFWVSGGSNDDDEDDLEDAQDESFRDPAVVDIIHRHFVPVRVSRNSDVIEAAGSLGLPTAHGLYCAVLTPDGRVLTSMDPGVVADPAAFAGQLESAFATYTSDLFEKQLRPLLENPETPKAKARLAAQTVYRLEIRQADTALIGLLDRADLTGAERSRLFSALAALGTQACVTTLLEKSESDKAAAAALNRVPPAALEWLLTELPGAEGAVTPRQLAAYRSAMRACRRSSVKPDTWWATATPEARTKEIESLVARAQTVLEFSGQPGER